MKLDLIACPICKTELEPASSSMVCQSCAQEYPLQGKIPCFSPTDRFYDEYADEHCPFALSPGGLKEQVLKFLPFWSWREWRFWNSVIPNCDRLLDFGCGRGREIFVSRARETIGFDVSIHFAQECAAHYDWVVQGALPDFPFSSDSFDAVASSHVLGHVPFDQKDKVISEIARLLKPGGLTVHVIETDSQHPIIQAAKKKPAAYQQQFVEQDGHIGLETADCVLHRFETHGFRLRKMQLVDAMVPSRLNFRKYLDHPDFKDIPGIERVEKLDRLSTSSPIANLIYEVGMGTFHQTVEQWLGKPAFAQFILVAFELQ